MRFFGTAADEGAVDPLGVAGDEICTIRSCLHPTRSAFKGRAAKQSLLFSELENHRAPPEIFAYADQDHR
jgi:hypothetical protein